MHMPTRGHDAVNWKRTRRLLPGALIPIVMATLLVGAPGPAGASAPGPNTYSFFVRYKGTLVEHRETPGASLRDGSPGPPDLADLDFRFDLDVFYRKVNINEPATLQHRGCDSEYLEQLIVAHRTV